MHNWMSLLDTTQAETRTNGVEMDLPLVWLAAPSFVQEQVGPAGAKERFGSGHHVALGPPPALPATSLAGALLHEGGLHYRPGEVLLNTADWGLLAPPWLEDADASPPSTLLPAGLLNDEPPAWGPAHRATLGWESDCSTVDTSPEVNMEAYDMRQVGTLELPTVGSKGHFMDACKPCAFVYKQGASWTSAGCQSGVLCVFCHLCEPGEKKRRKKEWKVNRIRRSCDVKMSQRIAGSDGRW